MKVRWNWQAFGWGTMGAGVGMLTPSIATLAAEHLVSLVLPGYAEMISSVAILGLFAGVALMAIAIPRVVSGR